MSRSGRRLAVVFALGFGLGLAAALLVAGPAAAHATVAGSDPPPGAVLAHAPATITLRFTEDLTPALSTAELLDGAGRRVPQVAVRVTGRVVSLALPPLPDGTYGVLWQVRADGDGHPATGVLAFSVGTAGTAGTPEDLVGRWLELGLLAGVLGGLTLAASVQAAPAGTAGPGPARAPGDRALRLAAWCAAGGALLGLARLNDERLRATGGLWQLLAGSRWGRLWTAGELILLALLLVALRLPRGGRRWWAAAGALGGAAALVRALGSHAAGAAALVAATVHIGAGLGWLGVALLAVPVVRLAGVAGLAALRPRLAGLAGLSVAALAGTGLYQTGLQVGTVGELVGTSYGRLVIAKCGLLMLAAAATSVRFRWAGPPGRPAPVAPAGRLRSGRCAWAAPLGRVPWAVGVAVTLLLVAGALGRAAPPRPAATTTAGTAAVADLQVGVAATATGSGVIAYSVTAASSRRPAPAPVGAVTIQVGARTVVLQPAGDDRYFGSSPGAGPVTVLVERAGALLRTPVALTPDTTAAGVRTAPLTDTLAGLILVTAGWLGHRRWRSTPRHRDPAAATALEVAR